MGKSPEDWERHEFFQKNGYWPKTSKQKKAEALEAHKAFSLRLALRASAGIPDTASPARAREILTWHDKYPDNAAYDNDGNPVQHD
jgi:hypothetical protein